MSKLSMRKISEVFRQRYDLKCSYRQIARSLNISISTVGDYLARARAAGIGWPLPANLSEQELYDKLFLPVANNSNTRRPHPDWQYIHQELRKKAVTLRLLWREYREEHPHGLGYTQFCTHYRDFAKSISPVMRQVYKAGEKCFVDYAGMKVPWVDIATGEIHQAEIFVGCLGASQFTFAEATATQQLPDWIQSHTRMWEYFGGVSAIVVPDNLKVGVTKAHRYDPDINANYQYMGEHYGVAIVPARVAQPRDKAKAENAVGCIERQMLAKWRHRTFTSIAQINQEFKKELEIFNSQPLQKMNTTRRELFESIDKPALRPLPKERYCYAEWTNAKIHIDYHFIFDNHYYSVPYRYIHHHVQIRTTSKTVECFYQGKRISAHQRSYIRYGFTTLSEHMPPSHYAHAKWTPERMNRWASRIGKHVSQFMEQMIAARAYPQQAYRSCLGLLRLSDRFGETRLDNACAKALSAGATRYQQVEAILKNQLDKIATASHESAQTITSHKNIRGSHYYMSL